MKLCISHKVTTNCNLLPIWTNYLNELTCGISFTMHNIHAKQTEKQIPNHYYFSFLRWQRKGAAQCSVFNNKKKVQTFQHFVWIELKMFDVHVPDLSHRLFSFFVATSFAKSFGCAFSFVLIISSDGDTGEKEIFNNRKSGKQCRELKIDWFSISWIQT